MSSPAELHAARHLGWDGCGTTAAEVLAGTLAGLDVEGLLCAAGLTAGDVAALRRRLVG